MTRLTEATVSGADVDSVLSETIDRVEAEMKRRNYDDAPEVLDTLRRELGLPTPYG